MFLKLTELMLDAEEGFPPREEVIFIQSSSILFMHRGHVLDVEYTSFYLGHPYWPKVKETPEQIMEMTGQLGYFIVVEDRMEWQDAQDTDKSS